MLLFHIEAKKWGLRDSSNRQDLDVEGGKWKGKLFKTYEEFILLFLSQISLKHFPTVWAIKIILTNTTCTIDPLALL